MSSRARRQPEVCKTRRVQSIFGANVCDASGDSCNRHGDDDSLARCLFQGDVPVQPSGARADAGLLLRNKVRQALSLHAVEPTLGRENWRLFLRDVPYPSNRHQCYREECPVACRKEAVAPPGDVRDRNALRGNFGYLRGCLFPPFAQKTSLRSARHCRSPKMQYKPAIDGLRALAVVSVLLFHANASLLPGGYIGVDVFFVVSGYLITSLIYQEYCAGRFTLTGFYARWT